LIGTILRIRYEITEHLADGPIFDVFRAKDRVSGRDLTVRVFKPPFGQEPEFVEAVRQTVSNHADLIGPGIEAMIEVDDHEGQPFLISEYSPGESLQDRIDRLAPFSVSVAVSTAISVCEALNTLHLSGVAHGDVSALNIVSLPDGQCKVALPGLWKAYSASRTAGVVALPAMAPYLAPEVSAGGLPSPTSDVYSVGILLYQLLSGRYPYSADTAVAMALKHATAGVPSVKIFSSATPNALDEIVKRAMAKDPAQRYATAADLLSDLRMMQDGLRFGKSLNVPLKNTSNEKQPVAPKMSAIREPENADKKKKKAKEPRDVPIWMIVIFAFFALSFLALIGVWVVFNVSQPKLVVVPNVKGSKVAEATKTLESLKLKLRIYARETNDMQPADTILDMNKPAGSKLHEGSTVGVKISTGSRYVSVPDLSGKTIDSAKSMLEAINLTLSENYTTQPSPKFDAGLIISQSPDVKAKVERFGRVSVIVSSGKSGGQLPVNPDEEKQFLYNLKIKLTGLTEGVVLRVEILDARGERTIYESPHQPGDSVEIPAQGYGREATFKIYYDNQLVTTKEKKADEEAPVPN
jgi:eukaryotic-like serine/threonine-protein kinase